MLLFGGSFSSVAQLVQKLWHKIGLCHIARSQNLGQNWPVAAKIAGFSKKNIVRDPYYFWILRGVYIQRFAQKCTVSLKTRVFTRKIEKMKKNVKNHFLAFSRKTRVLGETVYF